MSKQPHDKPIHAAAEHGEVVLDGPDGIATSLTPDAAHESAKRLSDAARTAREKPDAESP